MNGPRVSHGSFLSHYSQPLCAWMLDLVEQFRARLDEGPDGPSYAVAAIETLLAMIRNSKGCGDVLAFTCMRLKNDPSVQRKQSLVFRMKSRRLQRP